MFTMCKNLVLRGGAAWSARLAHNQEVAGSNPAPATKKSFEGSLEPFLIDNFAYGISNNNVYMLMNQLNY